jgi:hypothetical protein
MVTYIVLGDKWCRSPSSMSRFNLCRSFRKPYFALVHILMHHGTYGIWYGLVFLDLLVKEIHRRWILPFQGAILTLGLPFQGSILTLVLPFQGAILTLVLPSQGAILTLLLPFQEVILALWEYGTLPLLSLSTKAYSLVFCLSYLLYFFIMHLHTYSGLDAMKFGLSGSWPCWFSWVILHEWFAIHRLHGTIGFNLLVHGDFGHLRSNGWMKARVSFIHSDLMLLG